MANQRQCDELESLQAMYDTSDGVALSWSSSATQVQVGAVFSSVQGEEILRLRLRLPSSYLAEGAGEFSPPHFGLWSALLSGSDLERLSNNMKEMSDKHGAGEEEILAVWLEWLHEECRNAAEAIKATREAEACRAMQRQDLERAENIAKLEALPDCSNCHVKVAEVDRTHLDACGHILCRTCVRAVVQVHQLSRKPVCCPLPSCVASIPAEILAGVGQPRDRTIWPRVSKTKFRNKVVLCPGCQDRGVDTAVLPATAFEHGAQQANWCACHCYHCGLKFCGICRSPPHEGEECFSKLDRAVRATKRTPPLPPAMLEFAQQQAAVCEKAEAEKGRRNAEEARRIAEQQAAEEARIAEGKAAKEARRLGDGGFERMRQQLRKSHESRIRGALQGVFGGKIVLNAVPLSPAVGKQFMEALQANPVEMRLAFHGTNPANYGSIFERGLLIPGRGNELKIIHGAAHGEGVYTANLDAAWLSRGFCIEPTMLVCAVLQTCKVKHVMDAMIVSDAAHVVPLFEGVGASFSVDRAGRRPAVAPAPAIPATKVLGSAGAAPASTVPGGQDAAEAVGAKAGKTAKKGPVTTATAGKKKPDFKQRLAARSGRR